MPSSHSPLATLLILCACAIFTAQAQVPDRTLRPQQATPKAAESQRVALLIGNADYAEAPLKNPVNDARAMKGALEGCGFKVALLENATKQGMETAIRAFGDQLQGGAVGLFYFAGHGVQVKGVNYLVPVGAALGREDEIAYQAVDVGQVLDKMESAKNPLNLVILDACRNNPFARSWRGVKGGGLAQVDAPAGSLIAYATAPGKTAADGGGEHGLYTEALLAELHQPGLKLLDLFQEVRRRVLAASDGVQIPWESNSTVGTFYFRPLAEGEGGATPNPEAMERAFWDSVKDSQAAEDFTLYLTKYPQGTFAGLARQRREALRARIAEGRKKPGIVISVTTLGDCRDCEVEALVREGFQARGWREEAGAATLATVRAELEASTVASSDEVMAKWPVLRATLTITLSLKGQATPFKTLEIPLKAVAPTPLRCRDAFRKSLREALREQIPEPGSL